MSIIYNIKNNGPRIYPRWTPDIICIEFDNDLCIHTFCDLDSRYEVNHCMLSTLHLYSLSFCIKNCVVDQVKCFAQVKLSHSKIFSFVYRYIHFLVSVIKAVRHRFCFLKPNWLSVNKLYFWRNAYMCVNTCFSKIFDKIGRTDIGL